MLTIMANKDRFRRVHDVRDLATCRLPTREDIGKELADVGRGNWKPISHFDLAGSVYSALRSRGVSFEVPDLFVSRDDYSMILGVTLPGYLDQPDLVPGLFVRHSNDQSQALQIGVGGEVFVCSNGMITASWTVRTKHNQDLDLDRFVFDAVWDGLNALGEQSARVELLKRASMNDPARALLDLVSEGTMPQRTCHAAWKEYMTPSFKYEEGPHSKWAWYNAVTHAAKGLATTRQTRLLQRAFEAAEADF